MSRIRARSAAPKAPLASRKEGGFWKGGPAPSCPEVRMAETKIPVAKQSEFTPDWRFQEPVDWRDTDLDEPTLLEWFRLMLLGRQIDYRCQVLNRQGRAPFIISCAGHE